MRSLARLALLALASVALAACADPSTSSPSSSASPPRASLDYRDVPELDRASSAPVTVLWDVTAGRPRRVHGAFASTEVDAERAARAWLTRHHGLLGLRPDGTDLELATTRTGLAGRYLRFREMYDGLPVFGGEVIVLVARDAGGLVVRDVNVSTVAPASVARPKADVGPRAALAAARAAVGAPSEATPPVVVRGVGGAPARVVYRVSISAVHPDHAFEILVDAAGGAILGQRDRIVNASGTGLVFDPNPVATTGDATLTDNGNATSAALDAARYPVTLPNLDGSGFLRGTWVDAHTKNVNGRTQSASLTFDFDRSQSGFEETMVYFHLDRVQTRLQALGFTNVDAHPQDAVTDGQQADNSYFDPMKHSINYGQGGVDDAEDADIVIHEYGHACQEDQVPGFGAGGDEGAMGEGFGDYLSGTMTRVLSHQITDPHCLGEWDSTSYATGNPPCLRRLDSTKHFPEFADGEVHDDGEMWASALTGLDEALGADATTKIVIEAQFSESTSETFFGASQALLDADANLFGGAHVDAIRRRLVKQGVSRILSTPSALGSVVASLPVSIDNPRNGALYVDHLDDSQTFTHAGAQALRVHFATIDTELDPTCVDNACDNIYLTDVNGDLYQVLSGQQTDVDSVVIPGDTVFIRLVTDGNTDFFGYHVDRIDVLGDGSSTATSTGATGAGGGGGAGGAGGAAATSTHASTGALASSGSTGSGKGPSSSSVGAGGSGGGGGSAGGGDDGGCGCRAAGGAAEGAAPLGLLVALLGAARRRRRRGRQK